MEIYTVFIVTGYKQIERGVYEESTTFEIISDSAEDAIKQAKRLYKKDHYTVTRVIQAIQK